MKRLIRRNLFYPAYCLCAWLDSWRHDPNMPLPAIPCQLCGRTGHVERLCPRKRGLEFWKSNMGELSCEVRRRPARVGRFPLMVLALGGEMLDRFVRSVTMLILMVKYCTM